MSPARRICTVLSTIFIFLCLCLFSASSEAGRPPSDLLYFEFLDMKKEENGQVSQAFRLAYNDKHINAISVFYQVNQDTTIYQAELMDSGFSVFVDKPSYIRMFAVGRVTGKAYVAHADIFLFADSQIPPERHQASQTEMNFPFVKLVSPKNNYWNQTGQDFRFRVNALFDPGRVNLTILENGRTHDLLPHQNLEYSYVPPHDQRLREEGHLATRQDILFTRITDGTVEYTLTYSLLLHRSRYTFDNYKAGAVVFGSSIVLFSGWILINRRRSAW